MGSNYTTVQGDTWDSIAFKVYGDEFRAQQLLQAWENIELLEYQIFPAGIAVFCPVILEEDESLGDLPEWRRG